MATRYPLTGVGSGHFPVALGTEFRPPEFGDENLPWLTAHSMYFLVLGELGIPGIVCFIGLLFINYRRLTRMWKEARGSPEKKEFQQLFLMMSASLIAFCIGGAFLSVAYYPHIFVLSGLVAAAARIYANTDFTAADEPSSYTTDKLSKGSA
jgi:O-antigen ligase